MSLDDSIHDEITKLCEQGDSLVKSGDFRGALRLFHRSWKLLPEPKEDWDASTWILTAIGDAHFFLGDFQNVIAALSNAVHCPNGLGNPFVHLRLGEAAFELGQMDRAKDELTRAYMGAGRDIFANEDPKYLAYLETILQPMPGHEKL
jgi:tetratricopeptide (TPR) repeat protein